MKKIILTLCLGVLVITSCSSDKPSKEEVKKALQRGIELSSGRKDEELSKAEQEYTSNFYDCVVEETYDDVSAKTWKKYIDAKTEEDFDNADESKEEKEAFAKAGEKCAGEFPE